MSTHDSTPESSASRVTFAKSKSSAHRSALLPFGKTAGLAMASILLLGLNEPAMATPFYAGGATGAGVVGNSNIGIGDNAGDDVTGDTNVAVGEGSGQDANGNNNVAVGTLAGNNVNGDQTVSVGNRSAATADNAVAVGNRATASGLSSVAVGDRNMVSGDRSGAFGSLNVVSGDGSYAIGNDSNVANNNTFVLGSNVFTTQNNSVVLGNSSSDRPAVAPTSVTIGGITYPAAGFAGTASAANGVVSVGRPGNERQIINVAPGQVSSSSTDAVNGSQLYSVASVAAQGWSMTTAANGGTASGSTVEQIQPGEQVRLEAGDNMVVRQSGNVVNYSLDPDISVDSVTIPGGPSMDVNGIDAGGSAITSVATAVNGTDAVNLDQVNALTYDGWDVGVNGAPGTTVANGAAVDFSNSAADGNIELSQSGTDIAIDLADDITVNSMTAGNTLVNNSGVRVDDGANRTNYTADGMTILAGPSVTSAGIDAGNLAIANVDDGVNALDAVNKRQLDAVEAIANTGWDVGVNGAPGVNVGPGGSVDFSNSATDGNIELSQSGTDIAIDLADNIDVASVTAGNTSIDTDGMVITGGPSVTTAGIDAAGLKVLNVADGDVSSGSTDAVNGGQLFAAREYANTGWNVTTAASGTGVANGTAVEQVQIGETVTMEAGDNLIVSQDGSQTVTYELNPDLTAIQSISFNSGLTIDNDGIDMSGDKIVNLADGDVSAGSMEAVNGGQLYDVNQTASRGWDMMTAATGTGTANGSTLETITPGEQVNYQAGNNMVVNQSANTITYELSPALTGLTSIAITNGATLSDTGIDMGLDKITNLAPGDVTSTSADAVNGRQLWDVDQRASAGWNLGVNHGLPTNVAPGDDVDFSNSPADGNIELSQTGTNVSIDLADDIEVQSVTADDGAFNIAALTTSGVRVEDAFGNISTLGSTGLDVKFGAIHTTYSADGMVIDNGPSVTLAGGVNAADMKVVNVADGDVTDTSTDAINGRQLFGYVDGVANVLGGGAWIDPATGIVYGPTYNIQTVDYYTVGDALNALDTATSTALLGWDLSVNGGAAENVGPGGAVDITNTDGNIELSQTGTNLTVELADNIEVASVMADDGAGNVTELNATGVSVTDGGTNSSALSATGLSVTDGTDSATYGATGMTIAGGPSVTTSGIDAASMRITSVAEGVDGTDAVNKDQLDAVKAIATTGWNISAQGANVTNVAPGETVDLNNADGNIVVSKTDADDNVTIDLADNITVDSMTAGNTLVNNDGLAVDDGAGNATTVTATGTSVTDGADSATYGATGMTIAGGPSVTTLDIDAATLKIVNVADGEVSASSADAVNGSQLYTTNQTVIEQGESTARNLGGGSTYNSSTGTVTAPSYTVEGESYDNVGSAIEAIDSGMYGINDRVSGLDNRLDRVGAMSAALSGIQAGTFIESSPTQVGVAGGAYNGKYALALGLNHYTSKKVLLNVGGALSGGELMGRAGVTVALETMPSRKSALSSSGDLSDLRGVISAQNAKINRQDAEISQQRMQLNQQSIQITRQNAVIQELVRRFSAMENGR